VLDVKGLRVKRARRAAVAIVRAGGRLEELDIEESGSFAGIQSVNSDVQIRTAHLKRPGVAGLSILGGTVVLGSVTVEGTRDLDGHGGNALEIRRATVRFDDVKVDGADAIGLLSAERSIVSGRALSVTGAKWGGVGVEQGSRLKLATLSVREGGAAAASVLGGGVLEVGMLHTGGALSAAVSADCEHGARVTLGGLDGDVRLGAELPCVTLPKK
jgi:hypothetical protein